MDRAQRNPATIAYRGLSSTAPPCDCQLKQGKYPTSGRWVSLRSNPSYGSSARARPIVSTRNFGEYALLEDSRYTSQAKNSTAQIVVRLPRFNSKVCSLDERQRNPRPACRHNASLRAFTPVFDGLWTRVNALWRHAGYPAHRAASTFS